MTELYEKVEFCNEQTVHFQTFKFDSAHSPVTFTVRDAEGKQVILGLYADELNDLRLALFRTYRYAIKNDILDSDEALDT